MRQTTRLYNVPTSLFRPSKKKKRERERGGETQQNKVARKVGEGRRRRRGGDIRHRAVISPPADCTGFRKLSVTRQFGSRLAARCTAWRRRLRSEAGRGRGRCDRVRSGTARGGPPPPGRRALQPRVGSVVPRLAMISSFQNSRPGRGCHVPGSAPSAAPPTLPDAVAVAVTAASRRKGPAAGEGLGVVPHGAGDRGSRWGLGGCRLAHPHLPSLKGLRPECGASLATPRMGCGLERRALPGARPDRAGSRPAPSRAVRAPGGVAAAVRPAGAVPPAPRVGDSGGHAGHPPLFPRAEPSAPPPATPEKCLYLPPPPPPSRRRYPWRLGTLPSSGPRGCLPSLRVLGRLGERWG